MTTPSLDAYALTTLPTVVQELQIKQRNPDMDALLVRLIDRASARCNTHCGRRLKSTTYAAATALVLNGDGTHEIIVPEFPVTALASVKQRLSDGSSQPLDISGARFDANLIYLPNSIAPSGTLNIVVECTAGYLTGTHVYELTGLEDACVAIVRIAWQDYQTQIGRGVEANVAGGSIRMIDAPLPLNIRGMLDPYRRLS